MDPGLPRASRPERGAAVALSPRGRREGDMPDLIAKQPWTCWADSESAAEVFEVALPRAVRRRLESSPFADTSSSDHWEKTSIIEIMSPPRVSLFAKQHGMFQHRHIDFDVSTGWEWHRSTDRETVLQSVSKMSPRWLCIGVGSPIGRLAQGSANRQSAQDLLGERVSRKCVDPILKNGGSAIVVLQPSHEDMQDWERRLPLKTSIDIAVKGTRGICLTNSQAMHSELQAWGRKSGRRIIQPEISLAIPGAP